jgi:hypothetical protein
VKKFREIMSMDGVKPEEVMMSLDFGFNKTQAYHAG